MLRLPPYHPDLNLIEKIWGIVKTRIAAKNVTFKLQDVQQLAEQNFAAVLRPPCVTIAVDKYIVSYIYIREITELTVSTAVKCYMETVMLKLSNVTP